VTRTVTVALRADTSHLETGMARSAAKVRGFGNEAQRSFRESSRSMQGMSGSIVRSTAVAATAVGAGLGAIVLSASKAAAKFDTTMRQIAVATGAPASALKSLSDLALKMGKETTFSAQEVGDAMLELGKSGMTVAQIQSGALAQTLTLAAAGTLDLASAAGYVTSGLALFSLKASDSAKVAAALAGGANASKASVQDMGAALAQVGPGAAQAGLSLQETTGVLALFAKNGILGSDAGTSLKTMLARLVPQTDAQASAMKQLGLDFVDAKGAFLGVDEISQQLHDRLGGLSDAQRTQALNTIFGSDASRAASILMKEGADGVRGMTTATSDQTQADKLAKAATEGTAGAIEQMNGAIDTAKLQLGQALAPLITRAADKAGDFADTLGEEVIPAIGDFVTGMENGTGPGGQFVDVLMGVKDAAGQAWDVAEPMLRFIADHPDLFKQIAIDAGLFALALKGTSMLRSLTSMTARGGALAGGGGGSLRPVPVTIVGGLGTATGSGVAVDGAGRSPGLGAMAGRGAFGGLAGGLIGLGTTSADAKAWGATLATSAAAGFVAGGPPGAIVATVAGAVVMGFTQGGKEAAANKASFDAYGQALATATSQAAVQGIVDQSAFRDLDLATASAEDYAQAIARIKRATEKFPEMQAQFLTALDNTRVRYRLLKEDSLQRESRIGAEIAAIKAQAKALGTPLGNAASDSVDRISRRMGTLTGETYKADESLRVLESRLKGLPASKTIDVKVLQHFKATNPGAAADPELRRIGGWITTRPQGKKDGGLLDGEGDDTSDSMLIRASTGEYVVKAKQTRKHLGLLQAINSGTDGFASGGLVGGLQGYAAGGQVFRPRNGSLSVQARRLSSIEDINALVAAYDVYLRKLEQAAQREGLLRDIHQAQVARGKASAGERAAAQQHLNDTVRALLDFDTAAKIDRERAATDKLITSLERRAEIEAQRHQRLANMYELGKVSAAVVIRDLDAQMAKLQKYSDAWMAIYRQRQQILDEQTAAQQKAADAAKETYDSALSALNKMLDEQEQIQKKITDSARQHDAKQAELRARQVKAETDLLAGLDQAAADHAANQQRILQGRRSDLSGWIAADTAAVTQWGASLSWLKGNVDDQISRFGEWMAELQQARRRGVSEDVITALGLDKGPEALGQLRQFSSATQAEIDALNASVARKSQLAAEQTGREQVAGYGHLGQELTEVQQTYADATAALQADYQKIVADLAEQTSELQAEFASEQGQYADELAQIGTDQARGYAEALAAGLASGLPGVQAAARALAAAAGGGFSDIGGSGSGGLGGGGSGSGGRTGVVADNGTNPWAKVQAMGGDLLGTTFLGDVPYTLETHGDAPPTFSKAGRTFTAAEITEMFQAKYGYVYDDGGWLMPGQLGINRGTRPEPVFSPSQWDAIRSGGMGSGAGEVRVFIGERELTDIVRVEREQGLGARKSANAIAGRR
jgi:TP901 family phage tail tape measure protein